jgi:hypothetical protein
MHSPDVVARLSSLERQLRRTRAFLAATVSVGLCISLIAWRSGEPEVLRVRGIIVVDAQGRERIHLGSPVPDPIEGRRVQAATGLVINDTLGLERFGLSLFPNGRVVMGFDAPRGTGDDRNRERVSIVADERGNGYVRLLDRQTRARAFLRLGDDDEVSLDLLDWRDREIAVRRLRARSDTIEVRPR